MQKHNNTCCFIGHRKVEDVERIRIVVQRVVERLIIERNIETFLFGSRSEFNSICYEVVSILKAKYAQIKRIYVRGEYQYIDDKYKEKYFLKGYEDSYLPNVCGVASRASYVERNREMIDKSNICVFYFDKNYEPERQVLSHRGVLPKHSSNVSGTRLAHDYAIKKHKEIVNVFE